MTNSDSLNIGNCKRRRRGTLFGVVCALMASFVITSSAGASPRQISIPGNHTFPESITGTVDGTFYIGGLGDGAVYRVLPGASAAEPFIAPGTSDLMSVIGILADPKAGTLWVCSSDFSGVGIIIPTGKKPNALWAFDLKTGAPKFSVPLPGTTNFCQDLALGKDGAIYVNDQLNPRILRLKSGARSFTVWATDSRFGGAGYNLDGITFGSDGNLYVDTYNSHRLFRVAVRADGSAGAVTELTTSRPLFLPDAMRMLGHNTFLMIDDLKGLDLVTVDGDHAKIQLLGGQGLDLPVSVWQLGNTAWVLEGQLDLLFNPAKKDVKPHPFRVVAVPLN